MKILFGLFLLVQPAFAAVGSWNGVAFTGWNGVAQTSWNGTAISCAAGGGGIAVNAAAKASAVATSAAISLSPATGSACVVTLSTYLGDSANHAVTDNISGATGWVNIFRSAASGGMRCSMFVKYSMSAGVTTITADGGALTVALTGIAHEVTGITAFTGGETANATFSSTVNPQTGTVTNATAASIYFAVMGNDSGANPATATVNSTGSSGGTWALFNSTNSQELNGSSNIVASVAYLIVATGAGRVHGWTIESSSLQGVIGAAAFH